MSSVNTGDIQKMMQNMAQMIGAIMQLIFSLLPMMIMIRLISNLMFAMPF